MLDLVTVLVGVRGCRGIAFVLAVGKSLKRFRVSEPPHNSAPGLIEFVVGVKCAGTEGESCFRTGFCLFTKPGWTLKDTVAMSLGKGARGEPPYTPEYGMLGGGGTLGEASVRYIGGAAAAAMKHTGDIVVFIQGDGASNRAPTHEAMAVAGAWQLPIIFVIQNNRYGMGTSVKTSYNIEDLSVKTHTTNMVPSFIWGKNGISHVPEPYDLTDVVPFILAALDDKSYSMEETGNTNRLKLESFQGKEVIPCQ